MEIMLKDLVWKYQNKEIALKKLESHIDYLYSSQNLNIEKYYFKNAEFIAEQKAKINNELQEYTKQDIIEMFKNAGFEYEPLTNINYERLKFNVKGSAFWIEFLNENQIKIEILLNYYDTPKFSRHLYYNDRKKIEFYYNTFRNILEMEINCE